RRRSRLHLPFDQPVGRQLEEFGHCLQVPIGIVHVDVPQVGGQFGKFSFSIEPGAIPADQGASRKSVPHVVQSRTAAVTLRRWAETDLLGHFGEGVSRRRVENPATTLGDKERRSGGCRKEAISGSGVLLQSFYGGGMNRHVA